MEYGYINQAASVLNKGIDTAVDYVKENWVGLVVLLGIAHFLRNYSAKSSTGYKVGYASPTKSVNKSGDDKLRQARLRQQELADEQAKITRAARKEKERLEKARKNDLDGKKNTDPIKKTTAAAACEYNPMQPWSANSTGYK